jgi:hypothetical protein
MGRAAHANVLYGATEARQGMALIVRDHDHGVRLRDGPRHLDLLEDALRLHQAAVLALQAVGRDELAKIEAVRPRRMEVVHGVVAVRQVVRVGVRQKGLASGLPYLLHDLVHEEGLDIIWVAELAHVELDGDQIALCDTVESAGRLVEAL